MDKNTKFLLLLLLAFGLIFVALVLGAILFYFGII